MATSTSSFSALPVEHAALETQGAVRGPVPPRRSRRPRRTFLGETAAAEDILAADLLLLEDGHCFRDQALNVCRKVDARQLRRFGASSLSTLAQLVANGQGVTLLPQMFVASEDGRIPRVRLLRFPDPAPSRTIGLVWRRTLPFRDDVEQVAAMVRACRPAVQDGEDRRSALL